VNRVILTSLLTLLLSSLSVAQDSADLSDWHNRIAESNLFYNQGRLRDATLMMESALKSAERLPELDDRLPMTIHSLALLYHEQGRYTEAVSHYLRAIRLWKKIGPSQQTALVDTINHLIAAYVEAQDYRTARKLMKFVLPELDRSASTPQDRFTLLQMRAALEVINHDYERAVNTYHEALEQVQQGNWVSFERDREIGIAWLNMSEVFIATKKYQRALEANSLASAQFERLGSRVHSLLVRALDQATYILLKLQRPVDAGQCSSRAIELAQTVFGADHPVVAGVMLRHADVLHALHDNALAKAMTKEAHAMLERSAQPRFTVSIDDLSDVKTLLPSKLPNR